MTKSSRIKTILIDLTSEALAAILAHVQARASVNTLDTVELVYLAKLAENRLEDLGIAPSSRAGASYTHHAAGPTAMSYKYSQGCTKAQLVRKADGWHLLEASRISIWPKQSARYDLTLSQAQAARALAIFKNSFSVKAA